MPSLPESEIYLLVRTYFGDEAGWDALRAVIDEGSQEGFFANVHYVDDRHFDGFSVEELEAAHPQRERGWDVLYVADEQAITHPVHPLLVVRVGSTEELPFRCRADLLHEVDANLSLANLDWDDFRDQSNESRVYGGVEVITAAEAERPTDAAVAAHEAASDELIRIDVAPELWWEMQEDLFEAPIAAHGIGYKDVAAIAKRIYYDVTEGDAVLPRMELDDDVVVSLSAKDWAFIRERARQPMTSIRIEDDDERRQRSIVRGQIVELITRRIR
jgi:hypothetical protein